MMLEEELEVTVVEVPEALVLADVAVQEAEDEVVLLFV